MSLFALSLSLLATLPGADRIVRLDDALAQARQKQPQVLSAQARQDESRAHLRKALGGFLPRLDAGANYQRTTYNFVMNPAFANPSFAGLFAGGDNGASGGSSASASSLDSTWKTINYFNYDIRAELTLFDFGKTWGGWRAARSAVHASEAEVRGTDLDVAMDVRVKYFMALEKRDLLAVANDTVSNARKHTDEIRHMVHAGLRPKLDLSSAEVELANQQLKLLAAQNAFEVAKVHLNLAIGSTDDVRYDLAEAPLSPLAQEAQAVDLVAQQACETRPDFAKTQAQIDRLQASLWQLRGDYYPALSLVSDFQGAYLNDTAVRLPGGWNWYAGASLNWNLFGGLQNSSNVDAAQAQLAAAVADQTRVSQVIRAEILEQLLGVSQAKQQVEVSKHAVASADEQLALAEGRYKAGVSTVLELDDAQVKHSDAKSRAVQAQYALDIARARLWRAVGNP